MTRRSVKARNSLLKTSLDDFIERSSILVKDVDLNALVQFRNEIETVLRSLPFLTLESHGEVWMFHESLMPSPNPNFGPCVLFKLQDKEHIAMSLRIPTDSQASDMRVENLRTATQQLNVMFQSLLYSAH